MLRGSTIADNLAMSGAGMEPINAVVAASNCTIVNNRADRFGGGVYNANSALTIGNSILWGNTPNATAGTAPVVNYSDVQGGMAGLENLNVEPMLTSDYHLLAGSPCIDAGDPAFVPGPGEMDIDGGPRITGGRVDMGSDEYGSTGLAGDVNGDTHVDVEDLLLLGASFGKREGDAGYDPHCDFNGDDRVDISDLLILAGNFGN